MSRQSFKSGSTYIVRDPQRALWYFVQQVGAKSWMATSFATIDSVGYEDAIIKGNGSGLWNELKVSTYTRFQKNAGNNPQFRKMMFNILKYGSPDEPDKRL